MTPIQAREGAPEVVRHIFNAQLLANRYVDEALAEIRELMQAPTVVEPYSR